MLKKLPDATYNAVNRLASVSKMDCWFWLDTDKDGNDRVMDLENNKHMTLVKGISALIGGMTENDFAALTPEEQLSVILLPTLMKPKPVSVRLTGEQVTALRWYAASDPDVRWTIETDMVADMENRYEATGDKLAEGVCYVLRYASPYVPLPIQPQIGYTLAKLMVRFFVGEQ